MPTARPMQPAARDADQAQAPTLTLGRLSTENLLCLALALGVFVTSFDVRTFGAAATSYRLAGLTVALAVAGVAILAALEPSSREERDTRSGQTVLYVTAVCYFGWTGIQNFALQDDHVGALLSLIGLLLVTAAARTDGALIQLAMRRWLTVAVLALLIPAFLGQGFLAESRTWAEVVPGRYFGFSNPNAMAYVAGFVVILTFPHLRHRSSARWAALLAVALAFLSAGYTTAAGVAVAGLAYVALGRIRGVGAARLLVVSLATITPALVLWLPSDQAYRSFVALSARYDLSNRTFLWVQLIRLTQESDAFWTGLGDAALASYTFRFVEVASAHNTILQIFISEGFATLLLFVTIAAFAALAVLGRWQAVRSTEARVSVAMVAYWFVVSLASIQPGSELGVCLIVLLALGRGPSSLSGTAASTVAH